MVRHHERNAPVGVDLFPHLSQAPPHTEQILGGGPTQSQKHLRLDECYLAQ